VIKAGEGWVGGCSSASLPAPTWGAETAVPVVLECRRTLDDGHALVGPDRRRLGRDGAP
jgi:hypothetical protein